MRGMESNIPPTINALPPPTLHQFPLRHLRQIRQVVRARAGDDGIPDDRLVRRCLRAARCLIPCSCHVDEDLFRVPRKQARQVGVEIKADAGVFFFLGAVVVRSSLRPVGVTN